MVQRKQTNRIVFHHSLASISDVKTIREWHILRGFEDIGYHYVILKTGIVEAGRDIYLVGAHASGKNHDSIGVCFEGDFSFEIPTELQVNAAISLYHGVCRAYSKNLKIEFHRDIYNPCPGIKLKRDEFINILRTGCI